MSLFDDIYQVMPPAIQTLVCSAYGYTLSRRRYNKEYFAIESDYLKNEMLSSDAIRSISWERLKETVEFAEKYVPYYKEYFLKEGITSSQIKTEDDYAQLVPVLTKKIVQENYEAFIPENIKSLDTFQVKTSGTTGAGLVFPVTVDADRHQWAVWWRYRKRFGIDHSTWYAHFYGKSIVPLKQSKPPFERINYPGKQILYSAYHMREDYLEEYVDSLNHYQPPWIQGYPSLLTLVAEAIIQQGGLEYTPEVVTIGSESLMPHQKTLIEKAFGVSCRQHYGLTEMSANISECPFGNLHVDEDFAYTEFINKDDAVYDIVSTGFVNKAFVLLRYMTGDTASLVGSQCSCGRPGRIIKNIDGRIEDYVITPDGRKVGRLDHIVKDMTNIKECQIVQKTKDSLVFNVVKGRNYNRADEEKLLNETKKRIGCSMIVSINYCEALSRSKTGKLRFVVSELK